MNPKCDYINNPKIGVIIPAYNAQETIIRSVESVFRQTYNNWEIYIVDDGSSDSTGSIIDELAIKERRIYVVHTENRGKRNAHKVAIESMTNCDYVTFLDSDDIFCENTLFEICMDECMAENVDIITFNIERNGRKIFQVSEKICLTNMEEKVKEMLCQKIMDGNICGAFYKYEIVREEYEIRKYNHEDYINKFNFLKVSNKVLIMPIVGYRYFKQSGSITQKCIKEDDFFYYINAHKFITKLEKDFPNIKMECKFFLGNILLWTAEKLNQNRNNRNLHMYKPIMKELSNYREVVLKTCPYFSLKRKILYVLLYLNIYYPLYSMQSCIWRNKRNYHRIRSILM